MSLGITEKDESSIEFRFDLCKYLKITPNLWIGRWGENAKTVSTKFSWFSLSKKQRSLGSTITSLHRGATYIHIFYNDRKILGLFAFRPARKTPTFSPVGKFIHIGIRYLSYTYGIPINCSPHPPIPLLQVWIAIRLFCSHPMAPLC